MAQVGVDVDGNSEPPKPDFVWDAESAFGDDRYMFRVADADGDVLVFFTAVEEGHGTMATFSLASARFLANTLPTALTALSDWLERQDMERFSGPIHTWADVAPGTGRIGGSSAAPKGGAAPAARPKGADGRPARQGAPWTAEEKERVKRLHQEGQAVAEIASAVQRSELAIEKRLEALGLPAVDSGGNAA